VAPGTFGDLLRSQRLKLGLTQEGLAERAGLRVHAIQQLEHGTTHPYRDTTNRLIGALGLSGDDEALFRALGEPLARQRRQGQAASTADLQPVPPDLPMTLTSFVGRQGLGRRPGDVAAEAVVYAQRASALAAGNVVLPA
jgi:transcriptional regulator with XRE-family HTH domain